MLACYVHIKVRRSSRYRPAALAIDSIAATHSHIGGLRVNLVPETIVDTCAVSRKRRMTRHLTNRFANLFLIPQRRARLAGAALADAGRRRLVLRTDSSAMPARSSVNIFGLAMRFGITADQSRENNYAYPTFDIRKHARIRLRGETATCSLALAALLISRVVITLSAASPA